MALSKKRKEELVATYGELIDRSHGMIMAEFSGLSVAEIAMLRSRVREAQGEFHVTKNTLTEIALRQAGLPVPGGQLTQTTAVGFAFEDLQAVAKAVVAFAGESEFVKIKGGLLGEKPLSTDDVRALAELPPLPILRARMLGLINGAARNLTGVVAGSVRQVVSVVKAYADQDTAQATA